MATAEARRPGFERLSVELRSSELDDVERMSEDELTALLQRRFRRFLACGCDHRQALLLAVGLG